MNLFISTSDQQATQKSLCKENISFENIYLHTPSNFSSIPQQNRLKS